MCSPTALAIAPGLAGVLAECAGLGNDADIPLDPDRIAEADVIAVMKRRLLSQRNRSHEPPLCGKRLVCLDNPDDFKFGQPEEVALPTEKLRRISPLIPGSWGFGWMAALSSTASPRRKAREAWRSHRRGPVLDRPAKRPRTAGPRQGRNRVTAW